MEELIMRGLADSVDQIFKNTMEKFHISIDFDGIPDEKKCEVGDAVLELARQMGKMIRENQKR